jgi:23S rRNA pseudouridine1911/1915/1917 synthase
MLCYTYKKKGIYLMEKAYKLLAAQEKISANAAKKLIDSGKVFAHDKKIKIARALMKKNTKFKIIETKKPKKIFEDKNIIVIDKPPFITSEEISKIYSTSLLHRLDKDTSGILILVKDKNWQKKAIEEFKNQNVYKEYHTWVSGIVSEEIVIDMPLKTIKTKSGAYSKIDKFGKIAITKIEPLMAFRTKSKVKAIIHTGRTHQIRAHLSYINHPILGDEKYGGKNTKRVMLHHYKFKIFDYEFIADEPKDFTVMEEYND